jgi:hypothetical protein
MLDFIIESNFNRLPPYTFPPSSVQVIAFSWCLILIQFLEGANFNTFFGSQIFKAPVFSFSNKGRFSRMKIPGRIFFEKWIGILTPSTFRIKKPGRQGIPGMGGI